jgi:hypothetical protein
MSHVTYADLLALDGPSWLPKTCVGVYVLLICFIDFVVLTGDQVA